MTSEERERKIRELMADHQAAGGYISREEAERIIDEVTVKAAARLLKERELGAEKQRRVTGGGERKP